MSYNDFDYDNKQDKSRKNIKNLIWILIILVIISAFYFYKKEHPTIKANYNAKSFSTTQEQKSQNTNNISEYEKLKNSNSDIVFLQINPIENYSGNSKKTMYEIRRSYVSKSLFNNNNYEPNESVFGELQDGKPWWGFPGAICSKNASGDVVKYNGSSTVSRFLNNPNMLVGTYFGFNLNEYEGFEEFCDSETSQLIPYMMMYNPKENIITAHYKMSRWPIENKLNYGGHQGIPYPLILTGMNARDFGFDYIFISKLSNIMMLNDNNASKNMHIFSDFLHTGSSCGAPEGCNNISPRQEELEYYLTDLPASMDIKLWKQHPTSEYSNADIYYRIIFEEE